MADRYHGDRRGVIAKADSREIMNALNSKKLLNSKWTAVKPCNKERHFLVTEVEYDEDGVIIHCLIEAVMTRRSSKINWRSLGDGDRWMTGWH